MQSLIHRLFEATFGRKSSSADNSQPSSLSSNKTASVIGVPPASPDFFFCAFRSLYRRLSTIDVHDDWQSCTIIIIRNQWNFTICTEFNYLIFLIY